jgi:hypothetical protein
LRCAPFPRLTPAHLGGTKPYGFLYGAAQTSQTAGTLYEMAAKNFLNFRKRLDTLDLNGYYIGQESKKWKINNQQFLI